MIKTATPQGQPGRRSMYEIRLYYTLHHRMVARSRLATFAGSVRFASRAREQAILTAFRGVVAPLPHGRGS